MHPEASRCFIVLCPHLFSLGPFGDKSRDYQDHLGRIQPNRVLLMKLKAYDLQGLYSWTNPLPLGLCISSVHVGRCLGDVGGNHDARSCQSRLARRRPSAEDRLQQVLVVFPQLRDYSWRIHRRSLGSKSGGQQPGGLSGPYHMPVPKAIEPPKAPAQLGAGPLWARRHAALPALKYLQMYWF